MRRADINDKAKVVDILARSFINESYLNWVLRYCRNKNKISVIMEYIFDEMMDKGEIYIDDTESAVALWNTEKQENISLEYILRNICFLIKNGFRTSILCLQMESKCQKMYPDKYLHLYIIGVLPEKQGSGLASLLLDPIIEKAKKDNIPVFLETASEKNIGIYKKKGFIAYGKIYESGITLTLMKKDS